MPTNERESEREREREREEGGREGRLWQLYLGGQLEPGQEQRSEHCFL